MRSLRSFRLASLTLPLAAIVPVIAQPLIEAEPVVVTESPLTAEANGTSQIRLAETVPLSMRSFAAIGEHAANLHLSTSGAGGYGTLFSLRGLSNTPYFSDPAVAVYLDDLPLGSAFTYPTDLFGFGTVTVTRGPQPAGRGRFGEGGLIQFASAAPKGGATGTLRLGLGNFDARRAALQARSAGGGRVDATVAASYSERSGFIRNEELGVAVDDRSDTSVSARVRLRPTAATEVALQVLGTRRRDGAQPLVPLGGPLFSVQRGREGSSDSDFLGGALRFSTDTPAGRLDAITSGTRWDLGPYENRLVLPPPLDTRLTQKQHAWNQELRLTSSPAALLPWHLGAWFSRLRTEGTVDREIPELFPIEGSAFNVTSRTAAVFGQAEVVPAEGWQIIPALRIEQVKKSFARGQFIPAPSTSAGRRTDGSVLPKLTVQHAATRDTQWSASVGAGRKPGGWSAYTDDPALARFGPETAVAYETGLSTWLLARTLNLTVRAFDYEIRDYQIERSFTPADYLVVNAPRARSLGGEAEVVWRPSRPLTLSATFGVTRTTLRRFTDPFSGTTFNGRRAPYAPAYDARLVGTYRSGSGWFCGGDVTAVGRTHFDESEDPLLTTGERVTGNGHLGYETAHWRISAFVENIADVRYATLVIPGINHVVPGAPRTYGIELAATW